MESSPASVAELLQHAGMDGSHAGLSGTTVEALLDSLADGRPRLLSKLKDLGLEPLAARQRVANLLGKFARTGSFDAGESAKASDEISQPAGPPPPGAYTVSVRCAGALGGDCCPLNGKLRNSVVYTKAATVAELYDELQAARGYAMGLSNVRVSVHGTMLDVSEAATTKVTDGMQMMILGPNRGG
jgi:hypothetical protein